MIIHLNDKTNSAKPLYYQSLVLLYLPREKFSEKDNENNLYIDAYESDGEYFVKVVLQVGDKTIKKTASENVDITRYAQMKNLIGRTLLSCAFDIFGKTAPWGISTGVKPVKLAKMFVNSVGKDKAYDILTKDYMITNSKARLAIDSAVFEDRLMSKVGKNPCSVYVSIPFCPTRCAYCSFVSCTTPRLLSLIPQYLTMLEDEIARIKRVIDECSLNVKSIYVGGGTPAILDEKQTEFLLRSIDKHIGIRDDVEFTFEAGRPDCITQGKLNVLRDYNVSRISINTQTTNDEILKAVGRNHTYSDFVKAYETARHVGFKTINTDLIAGLPGESVRSFNKSVTDVATLCPENITVHAFTLKKSSQIAVGGQRDFSVSDEQAGHMTDFAADYLMSNNYSPYYVYRQKNTAGNLENVGYSKKGHESIYNIIMMGEYHTVLSAGAGAVSKIVLDDGKRVERIFSPKYPYEFLDKEKYSGFDVSALVNLIKKGDFSGKE